MPTDDRQVYAIRVDERTAEGWRPKLLVEHRNKARALRDLKWTARDARYGPHGCRRMTLLPLGLSVYAGGVR
jgi:hypothetical protein